MGVRSTIVKNILALQGDAASSVGYLPLGVQKSIANMLGSDPSMANADEHMKILLCAERMLNRPLISEDDKKSRKQFKKRMLAIQGDTLDMARVTNLDMPVDDGQTVALRHYVPKHMPKLDASAHNKPQRKPFAKFRKSAQVSQAAMPLLVFFHGGGFVVGDIDTHDEFCRVFAQYAGMQVLSVGYRLAPEYPAPTAVHDCEAALKWAHDHAEELGVNPAQIYVGGDSAGGNLSAVVSQISINTAHAPKAQLLLYPVTDGGSNYGSYQQFAQGYPLNLQDKNTFEYLYVHKGKLKITDPLVAPLRGDVAGVCPAFVVTAELDILVDEGEAYAHKLRSMGIRVFSERMFGYPHGFINMIGIHKGARFETIKIAKQFAQFAVVS